MKPLLLLLSLCSLLLCANAFAAYPVSSQSQPAPEGFGLKAAMHKAATRLSGKEKASYTPQETGANTRDSGWEGATAFGLGATGLVALIGGIVVGGAISSVFIPLGILFGILAIIFGAMGFRKKNHGLAVAGFVLGIVNIGGLLLMFLLALLIISSLYK